MCKRCELFLGSLDTCITGPPIDIVFLLDRSGSFNDDLENFQDRAGALADTLRAGSRGTRFGLASFKDFPFHPYGCDGVTDAAPCDPNSEVDYAYKVDLPLTDDLDAFKGAVAALTPAPGFSGADFPQSQYEALFQLMSDGPGRDLNNNGNTTDLGDIPPQEMNDDPSRPTFIFLFTDADFHDPGTDPNYPFPGAVTATRAEVIALAQNTPRIVGMAAEDTVLGTNGDTPALRELVNLTGGAMFNLSAASDDFDLFIQQAIDEIPPPVTNPAQLLKKLEIDRARIDWKRSRHRGDHHRGDDHHRDHRHDRGRHHRDRGHDFGRHDDHHDHGHGDFHPSHDEPSIEIEGTLSLPDDLGHRDMESVGRIVVALANKPFISSDLDFVVRRGHGRHGSETWSARLRDESRLEVTLTWHSPRKAHYEISSRFFPEQAGATGDSTPFELDLTLGLGETLHSREVTITHNQWRVRNDRLWLGPNGDPPAPPENHHPVASAHSAPGSATQEGSDAQGSDRACAMSSRNSSDSNAGLLLWVLAAMIVRRRRRDSCGTGLGHTRSSPS